jgi:hypothetical protein
MNNDERIRELCARVVATKGAEFQKALVELAAAIDQWQNTQHMNDDQKGTKTRRRSASN